MFHHVKTVGQRRSKAKVLLDHHHGEAFFAQHGDHAGQRLHDDRGQPFGNLIEQQQLGPGAQNPPHGQHLLLPARQTGALAVFALGQVGEHGVDFLDRHARLVGFELRGQQQVFLARQAGKNPALFGAIAQPQVGDAVGGQANGFLPIHLD